MNCRRIEIDPQGDTLVTVPSKSEIHHSLSQQDSGYDFLCSKTHLSSASHRARKMFSGGFKESIPDQTDGLYHWSLGPIFDPEAFCIVLCIIHSQTRDLPEVVSSQLLAEIAIIVDDLECHDVVWDYASQWMQILKQHCKIKGDFDSIFCSFVFQDKVVFEQSTRLNIQRNTDAIEHTDLPIPPSIIGR